MRYAFRIVNVFAVDGDKFSGNPLCVFEDAQGDAIHRPSRLGLHIDEGGSIYVSGAVIELGRGAIEL